MAATVTQKKKALPYKIALGFALLVGGVWFGYQAITSRMIDGLSFDPPMPGRVSIVGITPGAGYHIRVVNGIAQVLEGAASQFEAPDLAQGGGDPGATKRIPIRDLILTMQGNVEGVDRFVTSTNELKEVDVPDARIWDATRIQEALKSEGPDRRKLIEQLSVGLDGTPESTTTKESILNGIGVRIPITLSRWNGTKVVGHALVEYQPAFTAKIRRSVEEVFDLSPEKIKGHWSIGLIDLANNPKEQEDIRTALENLVGEGRATQLAQKPQRILSNAQVVVTDAHLAQAEYNVGDSGNGRSQSYTVSIDLNEEGRKRLWKFSRTRIGDQILIVKDGVPIAAPVISSEMPGGYVTVSNLPDEDIVKDLVETINQHGVKSIK